MRKITSRFRVAVHNEEFANDCRLCTYRSRNAVSNPEFCAARYHSLNSPAFVATPVSQTVDRQQ